MYYKDAEKLCKELMSRHGVGHWFFSWINSPNIFGTCNHVKKTIKLSLPLVSSNNIYQVKDTILHEIAHALAGPHEGHGDKWKSICVKIGAKPERCFDFSDANPPTSGGYIGACGCRLIKHWKKTMPAVTLICLACKRDIKFKKQ